jgi:hypothetical protein
MKNMSSFYDGGDKNMNLAANTAPDSLGMILMPEIICFIKSANILQNYLSGRSKSDKPHRIDHNIPQTQVIFYPNLN